MKKVTLSVILGVFITGAAIYLSSCFPGPSDTDYLQDYDVVHTTRNGDEDASNLSTFALPDSILIIVNSPGENDDYYLEDESPEFADEIKASVKRNMEAYGYTEVDEAITNADIAINITGLEVTTVGVSYPPCWGWGWPGWGGWYPGYPGWGGRCYYPSYFKYETGSLFLDMANIKESTASDVKMIWGASIVGLLSRNEFSNEDRAKIGIDQAFLQSPYLKKN